MLICNLHFKRYAGERVVANLLSTSLIGPPSLHTAGLCFPAAPHVKNSLVHGASPPSGLQRQAAHSKWFSRSASVSTSSSVEKSRKCLGRCTSW